MERSSPIEQCEDLAEAGDIVCRRIRGLCRNPRRRQGEITDEVGRFIALAHQLRELVEEVDQ